MTLKILGKPSIPVENAKFYARQTKAKRTADVDTYLDTIYREAPKFGLDPAIMAAQASHETGGYTSAAWVDMLNPAGIGHTDADSYGIRFEDADDAAWGHIVHLLIYARPTVLPRIDKRRLSLDTRFDEAWFAGYAGKAKSVDDLAGKWATDAKYAPKVERHYKAIAAAIKKPTPTPEQPGDAPLPANIVRIETGNYHHRLFGRKPVALSFHITDDMNFAGTKSWFQNPASEASAHVVIDRDGTIYQFVSSLDAAWTNGDYKFNGQIVARRDIPLLRRCIQDVEQTGGQNLNDFTINIEHVGTPENPPTEAQYQSSIAISKYYRDRYDIKPSRGTMWRHADINSAGRFYCPGPKFDLARIIVALGGDPNDLGV